MTHARTAHSSLLRFLAFPPSRQRPRYKATTWAPALRARLASGTARLRKSPRLGRKVAKNGTFRTQKLDSVKQSFRTSLLPLGPFGLIGRAPHRGPLPRAHGSRDGRTTDVLRARRRPRAGLRAGTPPHSTRPAAGVCAPWRDGHARLPGAKHAVCFQARHALAAFVQRAGLVCASAFCFVFLLRTRTTKRVAASSPCADHCKACKSRIGGTPARRPRSVPVQLLATKLTSVLVARRLRGLIQSSRVRRSRTWSAAHRCTRRWWT
jgi:hypothetical protein